MTTQRVNFSTHPDLFSRQLGRDMYRASEALKQLVANALDADCSVVDVTIHYNQMEAADQVVISDNGRGMSPRELREVLQSVGYHIGRSAVRRETIGSRGIGMYAIYALAAEARWETIAKQGDSLVRQRWTMVPGGSGVDIEEESVVAMQTGTRIELALYQREDVARLFGSIPLVKRGLFNSFAGYLFKYRGAVSIFVNGEQVALDDFIQENESEEITGSNGLPSAQLHHFVLGQQVEQNAPSIVLFAAHGTTIIEDVLGDETIPGRKYLCLVDSDYLAELTNTNKSQLAEFDPGFRALRAEVSARSKRFIQERQDDRAKEFLTRARSQPYYPYKNPPVTAIEGYRRQIYDEVLLMLDESYKIGSSSAQQQRLIFGLTQQLMQSEDLASVLTSVLGLQGQEVAKFADLLRRTSLSSVITVADLLVNRFRFMNELEVLVYGKLAKYVKERSQLHKIVQGHTWLFGEQYNLMGSDRRLDGLLADIRKRFPSDDIPDQDVSPELKDIPDLYLVCEKWNEGAQYTQHLVVELKSPSVRLLPKHVQQLQRYANEIVNHQLWSQKINSNQFTFILVSSEISDDVTMLYQARAEPGLISEPKLNHPTQLWALRWSDFFERRRQELKYLEGQLNVVDDPELLEYLKSRVGEFLPPQAHQNGV